ncbi:MBL fold metallo-hydrolase [Terrisporobacter petrolearius]|uniref:MBL fold metallo-hydrolase n=1 Tax=Terrisporobacter petrolearius TaxID=1460447 RepID=UPI001D169127|nr:MBL fold metallo-hydrolase [Terrisporobacter petrolearius]MCC3864277.1 MBL fold metallo-hydrolase [Terrisporobacter petrolearius]
MKLTNINGNTYYIKGGTNTGVIKLDDNKALIIDPGLGGIRPSKMMDLLKANNMNIKYIINTHEHGDHYGGCSKLKEFDNNIQILSSSEAKIFIDNPRKFADYTVGGKANKFWKFKVSEEKNNSTKVDDTIEEGNLVLNNKKIEIIKLKGHSEGSIGILTQDKVLFVGDLFVGIHILNKFELLLLYDVEEYLNSIDRIENMDFEFMILGHGKEIYSKSDSQSIIDAHRNAINKYVSQVKDLLKLPMTIDDILKNIIINNNLSCNYTEYHFFRSSIVSIISYLCDLNQINYSIELGEMLYYSKKA